MHCLMNRYVWINYKPPYNLILFMRIVVQRVFEGWVKVGGATISHIKEGIVVLVGLTAGDNKEVV